MGGATSGDMLNGITIGVARKRFTSFADSTTQGRRFLNSRPRAGSRFTHQIFPRSIFGLIQRFPVFRVAVHIAEFVRFLRRLVPAHFLFLSTSLKSNRPNSERSPLGTKTRKRCTRAEDNSKVTFVGYSLYRRRFFGDLAKQGSAFLRFSASGDTRLRSNSHLDICAAQRKP
jgi:hypothetical protein